MDGIHISLSCTADTQGIVRFFFDVVVHGKLHMDGLHKHVLFKPETEDIVSSLYCMDARKTLMGGLDRSSFRTP